MTPQIGVVLGSFNDVKLMKPGMERLASLGIAYEMLIASAHRTPGRLENWLAGAEARGLKIIIAGAGSAAHLPGVVASKTLLPVIGIPFDASPLHGQDALYSIVQMPPGVPVATVGINNAENAALLALHILALSDEDIRAKLHEFRLGWQAKIEEQNAKLYAAYPELRPGEPAEAGHLAACEGTLPSAGPAGISAINVAPDAPHAPATPIFAKPQKEVNPPESRKRPAAGRVFGQIRKIDPDMPDPALIEETADILLEGGVIALPTDTVYGIAADATNQHAVQEIYALKDRDPKKAIPVLVDSKRLFRMLIDDMTREIEALVEEFWPGALTLVARKKAGMLKPVSLTETIGFRIPDCMVTLAVISTLARPLAVTSANISGGAPATNAQQVARELGKSIDLILDAGPTPGEQVSTVLDVVEKPFHILRQGVLSEELLRKVLGDALAK